MHALGGEVMAMGPGDVMFMPSPVSHATGLATGVIAPLLQIVDALPTTMTGKVQEFLLRDQARALADQLPREGGRQTE